MSFIDPENNEWSGCHTAQQGSYQIEKQVSWERIQFFIDRHKDTMDHQMIIQRHQGSGYLPCNDQDKQLVVLYASHSVHRILLINKLDTIFTLNLSSA